MRAHIPLTLAIISLTLTFGGCSLLTTNQDNGVGGPEIQALQKTIMGSFDVMSGNTGSSDSRALTPFSVSQPKGASSRATAEVTNMAFPLQHGAGATATGSKSGYPETGQSSSWTVSVYPSVSNVYKVDVTTTFPSYDIRNNQVESYLVKDLDTDGFWTTADPVVDNAGNANPTYRLQNRLTYRDGSYQDEVVTTVKFSPNGFAAFDINASLDYPSIFVPTIEDASVTKKADYSSVVAYTRTFTSSPTYSFWSGSSVKTIVGIRYYTEHLINNDTQIQEDMIVFEKAVTDLKTASGNFTDAASSLFLPGLASNPNPTFLTQSVLRQRVVSGWDKVNFVINGTSARDTRMKTLVVNISGQKDFYITKINNQANTLTTTTIDPLTTTLFIPTGDVAEVLAANPGAGADIKLNNATVKTGDSSQVQITNNAPTGDLGTLWVSLDTGAASNAITNDIPGDLSNNGSVTDVRVFSGTQGIQIPAAPTDYAFHDKGTVQAWLYINAQSDTAGIVHSGTKNDFSDEIWSLQFMGASGQLAFSLSTQSPYSYDWVGSSINLATKKWYYVVATWDLSANSMKLYINGALNKSGKFTNCKTTSNYATSAPVVVGSQFYDATKVLSGYYGYNGKINGVLIDHTVWTATQISDFYNLYKANTNAGSDWNK